VDGARARDTTLTYFQGCNRGVCISICALLDTQAPISLDTFDRAQLDNPRRSKCTAIHSWTAGGPTNSNVAPEKCRRGETPHIPTVH
jgi:hypothetical protein